MPILFNSNVAIKAQSPTAFSAQAEEPISLVATLTSQLQKSIAEAQLLSERFFNNSNVIKGIEITSPTSSSASTTEPIPAVSTASNSEAPIANPTSKLQQSAAKAQKIFESLLAIDVHCSQQVQSSSDPAQLAGLKDLYAEPVDKVQIDFDRHSDSEKGYRLTGISIEKIGSQKIAHAEMEGQTGAAFMLTYDSSEGVCEVDQTYRGDLPIWVRDGDRAKWISEKGVPTTKAISALMVKKLEMDGNNLKEITTCSENAQTVVDVLYAMIVKEKTLEEAFAGCQTSQFNSDLAQIAGAKSICLTSIGSVAPMDYTSLAALLTASRMNETEKAAFRSQSKIREIQALTGIDIMSEDVKVFSSVNLSYEVAVASSA